MRLYILRSIYYITKKMFYSSVFRIHHLQTSSTLCFFQTVARDVSPLSPPSRPWRPSPEGSYLSNIGGTKQRGGSGRLGDVIFLMLDRVVPRACAQRPLTDAVRSHYDTRLGGAKFWNVSFVIFIAVPRVEHGQMRERHHTHSRNGQNEKRVTFLWGGICA